MGDLLETTVYADNLIEMQEQAGTNPLRVAVFCLPALFALLKRNHIEWENNSFLNLSVNMSIITAGIYLISMVTSGIMVGRLPIYTSLFNYITLPYELEMYVDERYKDLVINVMVVFYLLYYYYMMHFAYGRI